MTLNSVRNTRRVWEHRPPPAAQPRHSSCTVTMDRRLSIRRATSAGYRLPERPSAALASQSSVSVNRPPPRNRSEAPPDPERDPDIRDPVKQDRVWRELVRAEREGLREWEKNWSFLKDYDQLGHPRTEAPLPSYVSLYSDTLPNTSNQTFGSRICTELGKELMRMDKLLMLTARHQKTKPSPDMQPC